LASRFSAVLLLIVGIVSIVALDACSSRYYSIEFVNVGTSDILIQNFIWGDETFPGDPALPDIELTRTDPPRSSFNISGGWRVPETATITWKVKGGPEVTTLLEVRKHLAHPGSLSDILRFEFNGKVVSIYLTPTALGRQFAKKLIVDSAGRSLE